MIVREVLQLSKGLGQKESFPLALAASHWAEATGAEGGELKEPKATDPRPMVVNKN